MARGKKQEYPQEFGRYYLLQKIAMGGMAEIFRAKAIGAEGFEKVIVIKRILPHFCEDEAFLTMFKDEARVASHLNHANVVQIFDFDEVQGLYYIGMEYVEGQDLKRVLDVGAKLGKPMSIAQAVFVMIEAGQGLDYAHKREVDGKPLNIIHRDISPHNIMVSYNGEVKIMDFGIAKAASRSTKTRVGTVKGKCAYMSPEQARGKPLDGRSDLFALGVCLWEMLSGKRLFVGESDFETLNNVLRAEVPSLCDMNPEVPAELDALVQKSLARDREERHADVMAFFTDLRRWFYQAVPDPGAVSLRAYMHELFQDQISQLKAEVAAEAEALNDLRTNSGVRRPGTGSNPAASLGGDDEATMALDTGASGFPTGHDPDATMALPGGAFPGGATLVGAAAGTGSASAMHAQPKSKAGLFVGVGVLLAGVAAAAAFIGLQGNKEVTPPPVTPPPVVEKEVVKVKLTIKAPGAKEIKINGETEATSAEFVYEAPEGEELKILAIASPERKRLVRFTPTKDGEVVEIKLPEVSVKKPKPDAPAVAAPIVIVQVEPDNAVVTVNGTPLTLVNGNAKVPQLKLGDKCVVVAKAENYEDFQQEFLVKNQLETFEVKLSKVRKAAPVVAAKGKVTINAKPWAKVSLKGKVLGLTPRSLELAPGKYSFQLVKGSVTKTVTLTVKPGKTTSSSVEMF